MRKHISWKIATLLLASLALAACGGASDATAPPATSVVAAVATDAPVPDSLPDATLPPASQPGATFPPASQPDAITPPTNTPEPPAPTLALPDPNALPTQKPEPPTDTPTVPPLPEPNTIPGNGEYDDELPFVTTANDPSVGPNNGDGIADVVFQFFGPDGLEVYSRTERNPQYCAFGGGDDGNDCDRWIFSEHGNTWPNGTPAQPGEHTLSVTVHGASGAVSRDSRTITLNLLQPETQTLVAAISPADSTYGDELAFRVAANDQNVGGDDGAGIDKVDFQIVDGQGQMVHERTERTVQYCAFGGGDNGGACTVWRFSEHDNKWPSGIPVENGASYRLVATVMAKNGQSVSQELAFTIQR